MDIQTAYESFMRHIKNHNPHEKEFQQAVSEAAQVARQMQPRWVIPCNWGTAGDATWLEAQMFQDEVANDAEVLLLSAVS